MTPALKTFLGIERWKALGEAWRRASNERISQRLSLASILLVAALALTPIVSTLYTDGAVLADVISLPVYMPTILFGICTIIALLLRRRAKWRGILSRSSLKDLSLTHTAVALGCIPAVLLLISSPELLSERNEVLSEILLPPPSSQPSAKPNLMLLIAFILGISFWAAITEEVLFRGLLLASLRRWRIFASQSKADILAISISALVFGLAHLPSWGLVPSLALVGLGIGFGIAFVVTDEDLTPLILYHAAFDVLSISCALLV